MPGFKKYEQQGSSRSATQLAVLNTISLQLGEVNKTLSVQTHRRFNYPGYYVCGPVIVPGTNFNKNHDKLFFFWSEEFLPGNYHSSGSANTSPLLLPGG